MQATETTYDQELKSVTYRITTLMDKIGCTTDGVQIFVNHWGRWVAKIVRQRDGKVIHAFGSTMIEAMYRLEIEIQAI